MDKKILVKGDVSGIQDFIFNIKSKGAARELKGRSFFLKILVEVVMKHLFDAAKITDIDKYKISTSGGNFFIKLPADKQNIVGNAQKLFTEALQYTKLNISIVSVDYDTSYTETLKKVNVLTRKQKLQFYNDYDYFEPKLKKDFNFSNGYNSKWINITDKIKSSTHFKIDNSTEIHLKVANTISLGGYQVLFVNEQNEKYQMNGNEIALTNYLESLFPFYRDNYNNNKLKMFTSKLSWEQTLTKSAKIYNKNCEVIENGGVAGIPKLAALAMDVDGLGNVVESIEEEKQHQKFDKKLNVFFNKKLKTLINDTTLTDKIGRCRNRNIYMPKYENKVYTVTAGGDDTFFVGKWNTMLALADAIQEKFSIEFSANKINKIITNYKGQGLTISAGLVIIDPKFPVIRFAQLAESALKKAKYKYPNQKGNICLFNEVIQWNKLKKINELRTTFRNSKTTGGLLDKARQIAIKGIDKPIKLEDFWKMGYYLRNTNNSAIDTIETHFNKSVKAKNLEKRNYRLITPLAARLAELDKRK